VARARGNADEIGLSGASAENPRCAIGERKGDEKHGAARKTAEKNTEDSRSVRIGDAAWFLNEWNDLPIEREWREAFEREVDRLVRERNAKRAMAKLIRWKRGRAR
jgi:hypothetical protein